MSFISKVELKYQLAKMGIKVEGNYVRKKDLEKVVANAQIIVNNLKFFVANDDGDYHTTIFLKGITDQKAIDLLAQWEPIYKSRYPKGHWEYALVDGDAMNVHASDFKTLKQILTEVTDVLSDKINKKEHK